METIGSALLKCKEICNRYGKMVPEVPYEELFYQFCDDTIRMGFLVAASDGYVDVVEIDYINRTFGISFDYTVLTKSYGLDSISDRSYLKCLPISIKTVAGLEKKLKPEPNCFMEDTRTLYNTMKQFGDGMLNCTGARLRFSVMIQEYFINNILNYIFHMEEMDALMSPQFNEAMSFRMGEANPSRGNVSDQNTRISTNGRAVKTTGSDGNMGPEKESDTGEGAYRGGMRLRMRNMPAGDITGGAPKTGDGQSASEKNGSYAQSSGNSFQSTGNVSQNNINAPQSNGNAAQDYSDRNDREKSMETARGNMSLISGAATYGRSSSMLGGDKPAVGSMIDMDTINDILKDVDSMIGLGSVKKEIHDMVNMILINEMRRRKGLKSPVMSRHLVFTGNPGTGKTTIARAIGRIYKTLGILEKGHMIETDRSGMVAGYMGQTAEKVTEVVKSAMGGILFIDEAYSLVSDSEGDFGQEAINTLLKLMEDNRDNLVVIVAGYTDEMEDFINSNPGLRSRFNRYIQFNDYSDDELLQIFKGYVTEQDYSLEEGSDEIILQAIRKMRDKETENFGNARSVRNYFENVITNQANRLMEEGGMSSDMDKLMLIKCSDLM